MKTPTKKELKIILRAVQSANYIISDITEFPYVQVMDKNGCIENIHNALNDACIKLYKMMEEAKA